MYRVVYNYVKSNYRYGGLGCFGKNQKNIHLIQNRRKDL